MPLVPVAGYVEHAERFNNIQSEVVKRLPGIKNRYRSGPAGKVGGHAYEMEQER